MPHLQTLLGLRADRLRETRHSWSRAHSDYRSRSPWSKDTAQLWSRADRMDEDHNKIPDYSQDPHFLNSEEEEIQDSELLEVSEKTFFGRKMHTEYAQQFAEESAGLLPSTQGGR